MKREIIEEAKGILGLVNAYVHKPQLFILDSPESIDSIHEVYSCILWLLNDIILRYMSQGGAQVIDYPKGIYSIEPKEEGTNTTFIFLFYTNSNLISVSFKEGETTVIAEFKDDIATLTTQGVRNRHVKTYAKVRHKLVDDQDLNLFRRMLSRILKILLQEYNKKHRG